MLSGTVDIHSVAKNAELKDTVRTEALDVIATEYCHIFAESTNYGLGDKAKVRYFFHFFSRSFHSACVA
jgi:hypothetical protein